MFVTVVEVYAEVAKMELETERLLHKELKVKRREEAIKNNEKVTAAGHSYKERGPKCYNCGKYGHIKRNCKSNIDQISSVTNQDFKQKANTVRTKRRGNSSDLRVWE